MTTAFQSGAFQDDSFQIDAAAGAITGTITATQANNTASVTGAEKFSASITAAQANNTAAVTGAEKFSGSITATQATNTASLTGAEKFVGTVSATQASNTASLSGTVTGGSFSGSINAFQADNTGSLTGGVANPVSGTITAQQDDNTAVLRGSVPDDTIQMVHGWSPKRREKGSYWDKLLSAPVAKYVEALPEEVAEVIEAEATQKFESPKLSKAQAERDMRRAMDEIGFAYKQAYQQIYLELVAEMRQAQEDEQIAHIIAALI